jgi:hypothetical protein
MKFTAEQIAALEGKLLGIPMLKYMLSKIEEGKEGSDFYQTQIQPSYLYNRSYNNDCK